MDASKDKKEKQMNSTVSERNEETNSKTMNRNSRITSIDQAWFRRVAKSCPLWQVQEGKTNPADLHLNEQL